MKSARRSRPPAIAAQWRTCAKLAAAAWSRRFQVPPSGRSTKTSPKPPSSFATAVACLIRQCQPGERWAGLWDFPRFGISAADPETAAAEIAAATHQLVGLHITSLQPLATIKHGVTRFRITLHSYEARLKTNSAGTGHSDTVRWIMVEELTDYPLSVTGRKISHLIASAGYSANSPSFGCSAAR